jgi:hypothetical protein
MRSNQVLSCDCLTKGGALAMWEYFGEMKTDVTPSETPEETWGSPTESSLGSGHFWVNFDKGSFCKSSALGYETGDFHLGLRLD